jgi:DNA-binding NtrC family response regulator
MIDAPQQPQILVVDDETLIADTLVMILNMNGARAHAAYGAESALRLALELKPDIIISDMLMGDMSGIDLAIRLSADLPNCRLILISGQSANSELPKQTRARGYRFEFLEKPVSPQQLLAHLGLTARTSA